jgi:hypothetical protein
MDDERAKPIEITDAMIARRAFEISLESDASPEENWDRARRELIAEAEAQR